jgi:hypothetical protein
VHDDQIPHGTVSGALVEGVWSNGAAGSDSCTTNASGQCSVTMADLKGNVASVTFTVNGVSGPNMAYAPVSNDGDNFIIVNK